VTSRKEKSDSRNERLEQLAEALKDAQLLLLEQSRKLDELRASGGEPSDDLSDIRAQLEVVTAERDQLQRQLLANEGMQTETIALSEDAVGANVSDTQPSPPSIDDLMSGLDALLQESEARQSLGQQLNGPSAEAPDAIPEEMISPEIIMPEAFEAGSQDGAPGVGQSTATYLVFMDGERPVKIPLRTGTMTIGRSESASIRIDSPYISRIHARLVSRSGQTEIVDAGSTNGFKINSVVVKRHRLEHGDVIMVGQRKLTFVDTDQPM
jgi:hypothetical protein